MGDCLSKRQPLFVNMCQLLFCTAILLEKEELPVNDRCFVVKGQRRDDLLFVS